MSDPEPATHQYGVHIPDPGKGAEAANDAFLAALASLLRISRDSTWQVQASMVAEYARRYDPKRGQDAPAEPHTPASAPDSPPSVPVEGQNGSETLRAALVGAIERGSWALTFTPTEAVDLLLPLVTAYGDQRAAQALRDAADAIKSAECGWENDLAVACADEWLTARADELGRQT